MLTDQQTAALRAEAARRGVNPDELIAEAEKLSAPSTSSKSQSAAPVDQPKLFQYHLPFVTVREVRQNWLGLTDSFPGDGEIAADWSAKHGGGQSGGSTPPPTAT